MIFLWILLGFVGLVIVLFILLWVNAIRASGKVNQQLDLLVEPALEAVRAGDASAPGKILMLAMLPALRNHLYARLWEMGKAGLFPAEFRAVEKIAESDLANWLMHPNELAAMPSEMELVRRIPVQEGTRTGNVFLFRFRPEPGHWAAERGWMAGTTGPYWDGETEIGAEAHAFSELISFDKMSEEEHVEFLKTAMSKKGLVVPS